ncbi:MAG: FAD-dependent oxidoreductase [Saprospiraceae bacterium]|nr:FAD-dependent oxidoreductase [Saprospiraceae bacterium]
MQRRKFLIDSITGLPIIILAPSVLADFAKCSPSPVACNKSVIVVGAGISGLAAAKKLKENGFTVTILESQDKVGGRLRTNRSLGVAFDEGASWIHGVDGNPITQLADQAGMKTAFSDDESIVSYDINTVLRSDSEYADAEDEFYSVLETLKNKGKADQSFETVFNTLYPTQAKDRLWKFFLSTYLTFDTGDLDKLSSLLYNEGEEFGGQERISTSGYDTIPVYLANGMNVQLNQRVTKVDYSDTKIKVSHNGLISEADFVLVTVPLGVLKANKIEFIPSLPNTKQNAIQKIGMSCVNKFLLKWDIAFWDDEHYITYTPEARDKFNYFVNIKKYHPNVNALMTFAYADYARQTEAKSDSQIIDEIMSHLKDMYGNNIPQPTNFLRTRWQSNENSYGAYSYTAVGSEMQHFDELAEEIDDKLFFAGEHTHIDYFSTAHGAYLSGIREADKLIKICNTVSTSDHDVESAIEISPNPATDSIRIFTNLSIKSITVYNELGQEQDIELEKNKNIYIEKLAKGTYTVKIETDSKTAVKKFVKN